MNPFAAWIERTGLTKEALARALRLGPSAISKITKDGHWPTHAVALRIYNVTGGEVTPNDLLGANGDPKKSKEWRAAIEAANQRRKETRRAKRKKRRKSRVEAGRAEQRPE
jgi:transcriptional regulator with XRE-family HTH domain